MWRVPLLEGVLKYNDEKNSLFCMPGNKGGRGFLRDNLGKAFYEKLGALDITEVEPLDNLHHPEGIIREAEELLTTLYKSKKSYFLVNGSTSGNISSIFTLCCDNDKIIVERNCHRSIFNGIILRKLKPIYIKNKLHPMLGTTLSVDEEDLMQMLKKNKDAKAIIITYPNYYGVCCNLKKIIDEAHKLGVKVIVDSAHGAHFGINDNLPKSAIELGADIVITSAHKTIPSLTQGSYIHASEGVDLSKLEFYISAFTTTSPSYLIMSSLDYGRYYLERYGKADYENLIIMCKKYRDKINKIKGFHILSSNDIENMEIDNTKYVIILEKGYSGHALLNYLRNKKIQCEMSDERVVVLILSPFIEEAEMERLYRALKECDLEKLYYKFNADMEEEKYLEIPESILSPNEAMELNKEKINYLLCEGRISGSAIVPYPPGVPILMPGERISKKSIVIIEDYIKNNKTILGMEKEEIQVIKII